MRISPFFLLAVLLTACHGNDAAPAPVAQPAVAAATPAPAAAASDNDPAITMRYACDGNTRVDILGDKARAILPDGSGVALSKVSDSMPPVFAGNSLYFAIGSSDAHLSQEDGSNELACRPQ